MIQMVLQSFLLNLRVLNFKVWFTAIKLALHTKNKLRFITSKCERPPDADILRHVQWDRCNSVVLSLILCCDTQYLYLCLIFSTNAKNVCIN